MPWNLVLLPLLGGFWFITKYYPTKFKTIQLSRERLIFYSATVAVGLAVLAWLITLITEQLMPNTVSLMVQIMPNVPYTGTALVAFVIGPVLAFILNHWVNEDEANYLAIMKYGDNLEKTIATAFYFDEVLIFSLSSGKVYIGIVIDVPANLAGTTQWLTIVPYFSGYRDHATKNVTITTEYADIIESSVQDEKKPIPLESFNRVIRAADLEMCGVFEHAVWEKFKNSH